MADKIDRATRSRNMSAIRGKDTLPELAVRRWLHARGFRFRLYRKDLPGRPDILLPRWNCIIEVRGCFWHRHRGCPLCTEPKSNTDFWREKFTANQARDIRNVDALMDQGWRVAIVWQCACEADIDGLGKSLAGWIRQGPRYAEFASWEAG